MSDEKAKVDFTISSPAKKRGKKSNVFNFHKRNLTNLSAINVPVGNESCSSSKLDTLYFQNDDTSTYHANLMEHLSGKPIGLQNNKENVCFANSVFQLLNTIPEFHQKVQFTVPLNGCVLALKELFANIRNSHIPLNTSTYLRSMEIFLVDSMILMNFLFTY